MLLAVYKQDDPHLFGKAMSSILENTLHPKEILVVADGEITPQLHEVIRQSSTKGPVRLIQLPINVGLAGALNSGLKEVKTKFTIRADADDFNLPNRFDFLIRKLDEGYDLVGSAIREVDKSGRFVAIRKLPESSAEIRQFIRKRNPFNHMSVGFRTEIVLASGGYPSIHLKEDYALWATLIASGRNVCNISSILVDATAGIEMFQRRGGIKYALAEIDLQRHLVSVGLKPWISGIFDGLTRSAIFLAPNSIRKFIYLKFLRTKSV